MRYKASIIVAAMLLTGWAARVHTMPQIPVEDFTGQPVYPVVRVIDGDTVILLIEGQECTIRLIGVDTPETVHPAKPEESYGQEASRFLANLLKGESVYLEHERGVSQRDKYGRLLAYPYRCPGGLFVNLEIVRQGYGYAYTRYPFKYMALFCDYERKAKASGKGLWGTEMPTSPYPMVAPSQSTTDISSAPDSSTVYITRTGKRYHRAECQWLRKSKIPISLEDAKKKGSPYLR